MVRAARNPRVELMAQDFEARYQAEKQARADAITQDNRAAAHELINGVLADIRAGRTERFATEEGQRHLQHLIDLGIPF